MNKKVQEQNLKAAFLDISQELGNGFNGFSFGEPKPKKPVPKVKPIPEPILEPTSIKNYKKQIQTIIPCILLLFSVGLISSIDLSYDYPDEHYLYELRFIPEYQQEWYYYHVVSYRGLYDVRLYALNHRIIVR